MKPILVALMIFCACIAYSQEEAFHMQGRVVDPNGNPVSDAYVVNYRNQSKSITQNNGVFDIWILPKDSIFVTHVTFLRKVLSAFNLMKNPIIVLEPDTD